MTFITVDSAGNALSGTTLNVEAGQTVTLTFNGKTYSAIVQTDGTWSTAIPLQDMNQLVNGTQTLTASISDTSGNSASTNQTVTINTNTSALSIAPPSLMSQRLRIIKLIDKYRNAQRRRQHRCVQFSATIGEVNAFYPCGI
ncbi:MAG: hypothetical protein ACSLEN_12600 [Candidatus Malihini olakiniferum]